MLAVWLITGLYSYVPAQSNSLFFERFSRLEGLSQNSVYHISQDNNDFIWLATGKGLNRFDGYSFTKYFHSEKDKFSISSNRVVYVKVDKWNRLWLATDAGLNLFDQKTEKFYSFHRDSNLVSSLSGERIKCVLIDKNNFLWVGTRKGLNVSVLPIDALTEKTVHALKFKQIKQSKLSNNLITYLFEDTNGNIWAGTINGLNKIDRNTLKVEQYFPAGKTEEPILGNQISSIIQDKNSELWIATQNGLYVLNSENSTLRNFNNHPFFKENLRAKHVSSLLLDKQNRIWLGTHGEGLVQYHRNENSFTYYKNKETNPHSLANNHAFYLFEDSASNLFISSFGAGFSFTSIRPKIFNLYLNNENKTNTNNVRCIYRANKNNLWLGIQNGGLCKLDILNNELEQYNLTALKENGVLPTVKCILKENEDNLWLGTLKKGLYLFNTKNRLLEEYKYEDSTGLRSIDFVFDIKKDKFGNVWVASWKDGLFKIASETGKITRYTHQQNNKNSLSNNNVTSINIDENNNIWLTSWGGGVCVLNIKTNIFKHYKTDFTKDNTILSDYCSTLFIDKNDIYWIGTTEGLCRFDRSTEEFTNFKRSEIVFSEIIFSIEEDKHKNLWISTNMGISRLNTETLSVQNFDISDGLQSNEHFIGSSCKLQDGRISFGGKNGLNIFNPNRVNHFKHFPPVNLTNFQLSYKNIQSGKKYNGEILLNRAINYTDTLCLSYEENVLGFEFSACNFNKPKSISYAFMLKGFEHDWNYVPWNKRTAIYTNMDPGQYTLLLKARSNAGEWNHDYKKIVIIIQSPIWKTNWFMAISMLMFIFLVFAFIKIRTRYLVKQKIHLEKKVEERTRLLNEKNIELAHQREESVVQAEELRNITQQLQYLNNQLEIKVAERTEDLNQALLKAEDAQKLISSFLSNMSHELRTPMNAISGFTQLMTDIELAEDEKQKYGKIINENIHTLIDLVENVMDVAKLHTDQYQLINSVFDLSVLCNEVAHSLKSKKTLEKEGLEFTQDLEQIKHLKIYSDPKAFRLIIYNLLENALKYTEKGKVELVAKLEFTNDTSISSKVFTPVLDNKMGTLSFIISDTGVGIKEQDQKYIFEAFKKVEHDKKKLFRGTGLGLALVKNLTGKLYGDIELKSTHTVGTHITISIPVSLKK
jgi:signal transduction histidine kinase/ligand-binding sensor domain-containing protein